MKTVSPRVAAAATIATIAAALTGCAGAAEESTAPEVPTEEVTTDIQETLTIWHYNDQAGVQDIDFQISVFQETYPNVDFDVVFIPDEQFANRVISSALTQSGPDILWINPSFTPQFAEAGALADFTQEWTTFDGADLFPSAVIQEVEGSKYSIQSYVNLNAFWYNKTMLDDLGIALPTNYDELEEAMQSVVEAGAGFGLLAPGAPGVAGEWVSRPFFSGYGMATFADYGDPAAEDMFERMSGWVDSGYIDRGTVTLSQADAVNEFLKGETAFYVAGNWQLGFLEDLPFEVGAMVMPSGPAGPSDVYLGGQAEAIGAFTVNKELAWKFLSTTWLSQAHGEMRLGLGSIPIRPDSLGADVDERVRAYATAAQTGIPLGSDPVTTIEMGNVWSGLLSGQLSPSQAAEQAARFAAAAQ